jgi:phospholipid-binding lipoprotein MlaA
MNMLHEKLQITDGKLTKNTMLLGILFILSLALGLGGCAGNGKSSETQGSLDNVPRAQFPESLNEPHTESEGEEDFLFDPFEESDDSELEEYDPFEPVNSAIFEFNYRLDKYVVKPVAQVYNFFIPPDAQQSISNVFQNIRSFPRFLNNLFQAKFEGAGIEMSRFLINSTLGVGGLFDPAGIMFDLKTPPEDLGQTLGTYGVGPGPYLMVPFFGPYTLRDGFGFIGDIFLNPFNWFVVPIVTVDGIPQLVDDRSTIRYIQAGRTTGEAVNLRALNLEKFQGVEEGTLDLYGAVRNGYLQQRLKAIKE